MANAKMDTWEAYNDLDDILSRIKSLIHGAIVLAQDDIDQNASLDLAYTAEEYTERAKEQADHLYKIHTAEIKVLAS